MSAATVREQELWERKAEELFREYYAFVHRSAQSVLGAAADAEDVAQNLFLKFLRTGFPAQIRKDPRAYLYRAAVNESLNMIRSRNRRPETDGVEKLDIPAPRTERVNGNVRKRLRDALSQLSPDAVEIFALHYEYGYSDAEIASMLGHQRGKIAMILSRSRSKLKRFLNRNLQKSVGLTEVKDDRTQEENLRRLFVTALAV